MFLSLTSCDEVEDNDVGGSKVEAMAGDWYVQTFVGQNLALDYSLITTYNTASNSANEMWINDNGHIWEFLAKTPVNLSALTFSGNNLASDFDGYQITVNITNGKITKGDVITPAGNPTDGISFDIEFSDDPGTIYTMKGYKRTGFADDEH
ncbi:lipid-binding protein [Mariniflexile jejuense]|uniref:Lipid-binding protein n=1 Tax=Mariniflexile jejuense TaxID=1173582 RepID=A0ABW3JHC5_9FLAO